MLKINNIKNFDSNNMNGHWQWQEKGNSWRGVGIYHVTASAMIRHPQKAAFGELKWQVVDGQIDGAYVEWSPLGQSLWDCIQQIPVRHPQVQIVAARIMPDHLHMVLYVTEQTDLSIREIIRGWVQGCRKSAKACGLQEEVFSDRPFIRVMSCRGQLQTMAEYVKRNPERMAIRLAYPEYFYIQRNIAIAGQQYAAVGNLTLLYEPELVAVHVHKEWVLDAKRGDNQRLRDYKNDCILRARQGTVLVSPFISPDEAAVRDVALREGLPVIYILDNGMPDSVKYKPPGSLIEAIAAGRLLLLSPWPHHVPNKGRCTRAECTAMNAMAETIALAATAKAANRLTGRR